MNNDPILETGYPLPGPRRNLGDDLRGLAIATGSKDDNSVLIPGANRGDVAGSLHHFGHKLNAKFRTAQTSKGLRVWRVS